MLTGEVTNIPRFEDGKPRYFNFIKYEGKSYFFHAKQMNGNLNTWKDMINKIEKEGKVKVTFDVDPSDEKKAINVTLA